jgi:hypothetical protein
VFIKSAKHNETGIFTPDFPAGKDRVAEASPPSAKKNSRGIAFCPGISHTENSFRNMI